MGMADAQLDAVRAALHASIVIRPSGRSATADLQLATPMRATGIDPSITITLAPVIMWLTALWEGWIPRFMIARGMHEAIDKVVAWRQVLGPAVAVVLSLRRVG